MVERKAFLAKPKLQFYVSQCGEHDYSAQSEKEWRLLQQSNFVLFHELTWIIRKMLERKASLAEPKI